MLQRQLSDSFCFRTALFPRLFSLRKHQKLFLHVTFCFSTAPEIGSSRNYSLKVQVEHCMFHPTFTSPSRSSHELRNEFVEELIPDPMSANTTFEYQRVFEKTPKLIVTIVGFPILREYPLSSSLSRLWRGPRQGRVENWKALCVEDLCCVPRGPSVIISETIELRKNQRSFEVHTFLDTER